MSPRLQDEDLLSALAGLRFGQAVRWYARVDSTNDEAKRLADSGMPEGLLVVAEEQTHGRGRSGRRWLTPPGTGLAISLLLRPKLPALLAPRLSMLAGLSVAEAVEQVTGLPACLKWPNDVLLGGKKAGGILVETGLAGEQLDYAVIGIGLNIGAAPPPEMVDFPATSLQAEAGAGLDRVQVLRAVLERMQMHYAQIGPDSGRALHQAWSARLAWLGQQVTATTSGGDYVGLAETADEDGALIIRLDSGQTVRVLAGDVRLRPAS